MRVWLYALLVGCLMLTACADRQVAFKARGQAEMGFSYGGK